jgi:hypothetical protein
MSNASYDLHLIVFDFHAATAPMALLATREVFVDVAFFQGKVSHHPLCERYQALSV